jgi:hypothetical protein
MRISPWILVLSLGLIIEAVPTVRGGKLSGYCSTIENKFVEAISQCGRTVTAGLIREDCESKDLDIPGKPKRPMLDRCRKAGGLLRKDVTKLAAKRINVSRIYGQR